MATEPKPKATGKKKRRRAPREEIVDYVVEIDGWDWGYSLSLNTMPREADPYHEFRHLRSASSSRSGSVGAARARV